MISEENAGSAGITIKYRELFFCLYFAVMFGMRMWGVYEGTALYGPLLIIGFALWGISVLMSRHSLFEYLIMAAFLALAGLVYIKSGEKGLLLYFTLMLGMKGIDEKKLFRAGVIVGGAGMICLTFLTSFGILEDVAYLQSRPHVGTVFRHALGMPHPNTLSTSFTIIAVMIIYLIGNEDKKRVWKASVLLAVIAAYLYIYSGSRTGIAITFGLLALNLIYTYRKKIGIIEKAVLILLFPFIWVFSIVLPAVASDELVAGLMKIDSNLMVRIRIGREYLQQNPVTLFGSRVVNKDSVYGIDLSQLYLFLNLGIVAFVIVNILNIMLVADEVRNNRIRELVITFSFLLMGITDPFLYNISFKNICFVFMGVMLYKQLETVSPKLPGWMNREICPLRIGEGKLTARVPEWIADLKKAVHQMTSGKKKLIMAVSMAAALAVATVIYAVTPKPEYVLADRNEKEHILIKTLEGRTYTDQEIKEIEAQGNIVLNYTDENELMYVYYSDENRPIEGGFYSENAAIMEKIRRSISVFCWGTVLVYGAAMLMNARLTDRKKRQEKT